MKPVLAQLIGLAMLVGTAAAAEPAAIPPLMRIFECKAPMEALEARLRELGSSAVARASTRDGVGMGVLFTGSVGEGGAFFLRLRPAAKSHAATTSWQRTPAPPFPGYKKNCTSPRVARRINSVRRMDGQPISVELSACSTGDDALIGLLDAAERAAEACMEISR